MVNFICDACGQTIKKQKVEKHYQTECRRCSVLSCLDCGKDFPGDSYASHTSCISEAEKYQGKLYKGKDKANKGERKQQEWLEQVRNASGDSSNQDPRVRKLMAKITSYNNVPRKEAKFKKFCENSINIRDEALLEKLWQTFSGARNQNVSKDESNDDQNSSKNVPEENIETTCSGENGISESSESKTVEMKNEEEEEEKEDEISQKSRKESKREKRKRRKMEAELVRQVDGTEEEILERKNKSKRKMEEEQQDGNEGETVGKNKKKKKRKYDEIVKREPNESKAEENESEKGQNDELGKKKKKKLKNLENMEPNMLSKDCQQEKNETGHNEETVETQEKFRWEAVIKKVLKSAPDNEMAVKKLRKKVVNEFLTHGGDPRSRTEQELRALFEKKLHKNPKVKVHKEKAKYCK